MLARRESTAPVKVAEPPVAWVPPDDETVGVTRRQFFNRSIVVSFALGLTTFSAGMLAFLWPSGTGGFGSKIKVGKLSDIQAAIDEGDGFAYYPEGRMWVTNYPSAALDKAEAAYSPPELAGMEAGFVALYQKCPHLGCRVPQCLSSQWFECGCHGSQYNRVGEKKGGPAPRGMDRFAMTIDGDSMTVDTGTVIEGPPDRHQHHRPGGRGPPLRLWRRRPLMSPLSTSPTVLAASTVTTIGATLVVLLILGLLLYVWVNLRAGRDEVGSEIELAPNRKPYYDDETLETTVLNRTLRWALVLLIVIAVALPLYWLSEPTRQSGAIEDFQSTFVARGEQLYVEGSQCQNCHGPEGTGGQAPYTITDAEGAFVATVNWRAPALDTVLLRFTREEVEYIINFGRPFSPMPGWGAAVNKGPLNEQQVTNLVDYLESIQLSSDEAKRQVEEGLVEELGLVDEGASDDEIDRRSRTSTTTTRRSARRCSTSTPWPGAPTPALGATPGAGRSSRRARTPSARPTPPIQGVYVGFPDGSGAFGPNLTGGLIPRQFANYDELIAFVTTGSVDGEAYGNNGIGSGRMPGFGDNPNTEEVEGDGMMTPEMIAAITRYEANLPGSTTPNPAGAPSVEELTAEEEG